MLGVMPWDEKWSGSIVEARKRASPKTGDGEREGFATLHRTRAGKPAGLSQMTTIRFGAPRGGDCCPRGRSRYMGVSLGVRPSTRTKPREELLLRCSKGGIAKGDRERFSPLHKTVRILRYPLETDRRLLVWERSVGTDGKYMHEEHDRNELDS